LSRYAPAHHRGTRPGYDSRNSAEHPVSLEGRRRIPGCTDQMCNRRSES